MDYKRQRPRNDRGYLARELTDEKIIAVLTDSYQSPHQVADKLGYSLSGAQKALKRMYGAGLISGELITNRWLYKKKENSCPSPNP